MANILSLWIGLFGYNEVRTTAGIVAGVIEVAAFLALGTYATFFARMPTERSANLQLTARRALPPLGGLAVLVLVLGTCPQQRSNGSSFERERQFGP